MPTYPKRRGTTRLASAAEALVPRSMRSSLVSTPMVRSPSGSTARAMWRASELARSTLACRVEGCGEVRVMWRRGREGQRERDRRRGTEGEEQKERNRGRGTEGEGPCQ